MTNTYGPRMDIASNTKGFVGIFVRKALSGERIQVYGDGRQRRDFNYVDDVVEALLAAAANDRILGRVFNLGHAEPRSLLEVVEILHRATGVNWELVPFPPELLAIDIGDYFGAFARFHAATGWSLRVDLEEGLARTLDYHRTRLPAR